MIFDATNAQRWRTLVFADAAQVGVKAFAEDGAVVLPTGEQGNAVSYGDEVTITADMLKMMDEEDEE